MPNIRTVDMLFLDDLFEMSGGYVLNFSNQTFARFFADEIGVDIDDPKYATNGTSKGKRLRCLLQTAEVSTVVRTLNALWEYREALRLRANEADRIPGAGSRLAEFVTRLQGTTRRETRHANEGRADRQLLARLQCELLALPSLDPQPRGYAFEKFLKRLFDAYGLEAREPFRLQGEQIDGSFLLSSEIYLLEAKWQDALCGVEALHSFHGKIEQKAAWTRGLFISNSGFSPDGLVAFGRGKRVICMDGYDLYDVLSRELPLSQVLDRKVRHAAETGNLFARVRDLIPASA